MKKEDKSFLINFGIVVSVLLIVGAIVCGSVFTVRIMACKEVHIKTPLACAVFADDREVSRFSLEQGDK